MSLPSFPTRLIPLFNLGLRGASLVSRFFLSFYIVKELGLEASGLYGLSQGAVALTPALVGWGINYFVFREVVGMSPYEAGLLMKARYLISLASLLAGTIVTVTALTLAGHDFTRSDILIGIVVWLETLALDTHLPMVGLEMPFQANVLVFVRTALWVPAVIAVAFLFPQSRSVDAIFIGWAASYVLVVLLLARFLKGWPIMAIMQGPLRFGWLKANLRRSWLIYLSDLGLVALSYLDRYILTFLLSLSAAGIYSFYWSLASALQTLILTSVVQLAQPRVVKAFRQGGRSDWSKALQSEFWKAITASLVLGALVYGAGLTLIKVTSVHDVQNHNGLFVLLLAATMVRICSDIANIGLTSATMDRSYAYINIAGIFVTAGCSFLFISQFGLAGTGISALVTSSLLCAARLYCLSGWRFPRPGVAQQI